MTGTTHVIGAGLAGLSAATALAEAGRRVVLYDAAKAAGGRCRSYFDSTLGLEIDNGNHLLLSGNHAALRFLRRIGGLDALTGSDEATFPFADLRTGERWTVRPNSGRLPWWVLIPSRRVPGTRARDYLGTLALLRADPLAAIGDVVETEGAVWERLLHPVLLAVLNTEPEAGTAGLAATVLRETLGAGGRACRPLVAARGLSAAFVDPALRLLNELGAERRFGTRLRAFETDGSRVTGLALSDGTVPLVPGDEVVLAVPPWVAADLLPGVPTPTEFRGILNAHFAVVPPDGQPHLLGLVGGCSEWLFAYSNRLSVTVSAGDRFVDTPREGLARLIWAEVARLTGHDSDALPGWQIVKERRATFAAVPATESRRPGPATHLANLVLAGDWIATGLPATIEGAIRSGEMAAAMLQGGHGRAPSRVAKASA